MATGHFRGLWDQEVGITLYIRLLHTTQGRDLNLLFCSSLVELETFTNQCLSIVFHFHAFAEGVVKKGSRRMIDCIISLTEYANIYSISIKFMIIDRL